MISALRKQVLNQSEIASNLGRHRSTICRELKRNASWLGRYRPRNAIEMTSGRRARSRRNVQFDHAHFRRIERIKDTHLFCWAAHRPVIGAGAGYRGYQE